MLHKLGWLALAGALGTLARYGLAGLAQRATSLSFPVGTLAVNLTGCFLAGMLWALFEARWPVSGETRLIVLVGFLGAFTTLSGYLLETAQLMRSSEWMYAMVNVALQNGLGFAALLAGLALGRMA